MSAAAIPMLDLAAQNGPLGEEVRAAIERVISSNHFIQGPEVQAFESEIAEHLGVPHALGVSSGTDALMVALMTLGVGPGDEVVTTPFTFFATAGCIRRVGARPVFADIDPRSYNIDPESVERCMSKRTRAILTVHLFGQPSEMAALAAIAEQHQVPIVEDAAQAIGARLGGQPVGGMGAFGCFSFYPSKNLGAFGDAGLVTTTDAAFAERARVLRAHGSKPKYFHALVGGNFRLDAIQAAVLRVKLPHLAGWTEARQRNAELYDRLFADAGLAREVLMPPARIHAGHIYNQYVIRTPKRDGLRQHLTDEGIGSVIYYPRPLHLQACFADLGYETGALPHAELACEQVLALPVFPELGPARIERVANVVVDFLTRRR